jgi:replicative DNA helicase
MNVKATQPPSKNGATKPSGGAAEYQIESMNSDAFNTATFPRDWLIDRILVSGQPGVVGGAKKTLKTSMVVDMAVSIGSGTPFLGHFPVPKCRRVAVFSGESGHATLQEIARRVCAARDLSLADCQVEWAFQLPNLDQKDHRLVLNKFLREKKVQVVFIDPLFMCLVSGAKSVSTSNLYEVGPLLWRVAQTCLNAGATPILVHHATKAASKRTTGSDQPLDLDDLSFSGIAEFARQWLLLSRREEYQPSTGRSRLVMAAGGSAGHSGCWAVNVEEGVLCRDFGGREWAVEVIDINASRRGHADERYSKPRRPDPSGRMG